MVYFYSAIFSICTTVLWCIIAPLFTSEFSNEQLILIMDGAGWHKSGSLVIPSNIKIIHLPPYCPELNPIERLWQYIKKHILRNVVYESLDDLEDKLIDFINLITPDTLKQVCSASYMIS